MFYTGHLKLSNKYEACSWRWLRVEDKGLRKVHPRELYQSVSRDILWPVYLDPPNATKAADPLK